MDALNPHRSLCWSFQERSFLGRIALLCVLLFGLNSQLFGQTNGTWTNTSTTASVGWSTAAAWLNSIVAGGAGSTATITANQTVNKQINLVNTGTTTLGVINIGDPDGSNGYTLSGSAGASLTFDNNNANAQFNVVSGSGTVTLASGVQSVVLNDNVVISQSSASLLSWATATKGGSGTDVKIIEHGGSGSGGVTISGVIANGDAGTGAVSVRQNNSNGTMTLSGDNSYTGGTTVDAGTLALGNNNRLSNAGALTINGGTFDMRTFSDTVGAVTINGGSVIGSSTTGLLGSSYAVTGGTISAVLGGTGALTKTGAGTTVLSGVNTYTGGTTVDAGTLALGADSRLSDTGALTINGGTFDMGGFSDTVGAVTVNGGSLINSSTTGLTGSSYAVTGGTISAKLAGNGGLTKTGAGTATLSRANTYTGTTTVSQGTLLVDSTGSNASSSSVVNGGLLNVNGTAGAVAVNSGGSLGGSGTVGALTLNSGGFLNPGNSPGTLNATSASLLAGSTYNWEINNAAGAPGAAGTNWDLLNVSGALNLSTLDPSNKLNLVLKSLDSSGLATTSLLNFSSGTDYSWVFAQAGSISNDAFTVGADVTDYFIINTTAFNGGAQLASYFKVEVGETTVSGSTLKTLQLMTIPEPSTGALLGFGLGGLVLTRLLRRKQS